MKIRRRLGVSPGPLGLERADDRNLVDGRPDARMPVEVEVDVQRLPRRFQQRRRLLQKRRRRPRAGRPSTVTRVFRFASTDLIARARRAAASR